MIYQPVWKIELGDIRQINMKFKSRKVQKGWRYDQLYFTNTFFICAIKKTNLVIRWNYETVSLGYLENNLNELYPNPIIVKRTNINLVIKYFKAQWKHNIILWICHILEIMLYFNILFLNYLLFVGTKTTFNHLRKFTKHTYSTTRFPLML